MRSLSVIIAMLASSTMVGQAYNCGMFGMISDDNNIPYVARFNTNLDSIYCESMADCIVTNVAIDIKDVKSRKRWTIIKMHLLHEDFDD